MKSRPLFFDLYNQVFVNLLYINQTWWWWRWWLENELKLYLVNAITGKDIVLWDMQLNPFNVCVCVRPVEDFPNSLLYNMWSFGVPRCSFSIRLAPSYILTTTGVLLLCSPIFSLEKKAYSENKKERKKRVVCYLEFHPHTQIRQRGCTRYRNQIVQYLAAVG